MKDCWNRTVLWVMVLGSAVAVSACGGGSSEPAAATPPQPAATLDSTFGAGGIVATPDRSPPPDALVGAIAIQPDGKIVAAGSAGDPGSFFVKPTPAPALVRYNQDGTLDRGFGNAGTYAGPPVGIGRIALQPDGKIVALSGNDVIRINANGTLDVTFGAAGTGIVELDVDSNTAINDLALQPDGRIVLQGTAGTKSMLAVCQTSFCCFGSARMASRIRRSGGVPEQWSRRSMKLLGFKPLR